MPSKKKKYNARFPPARIKKIMQTDEDVGKVAAAVPVIISRALELFIDSLIEKTASVTRAKNAKTLSSSHVKQAIHSEKTFDFLRDLVKNVPDHQTEDDGDAPVPSGSGVVEKKPKIPRPRKPKEEGGSSRGRGRPRKVPAKEKKESESEMSNEETETDEENTADEDTSSNSAQMSSNPAAQWSANPAAQMGVNPASLQISNPAALQISNPAVQMGSNMASGDFGPHSIPHTQYNSQIVSQGHMQDLSQGKFSSDKGQSSEIISQTHCSSVEDQAVPMQQESHPGSGSQGSPVPPGQTPAQTEDQNQPAQGMSNVKGEVISNVHPPKMSQQNVPHQFPHPGFPMHNMMYPQFPYMVPGQPMPFMQHPQPSAGGIPPSAMPGSNPAQHPPGPVPPQFIPGHPAFMMPAMGQNGPMIPMGQNGPIMPPMGQNGPMMPMGLGMPGMAMGPPPPLVPISTGKNNKENDVDTNLPLDMSMASKSRSQPSTEPATTIAPLSHIPTPAGMPTLSHHGRQQEIPHPGRQPEAPHPQVFPQWRMNSQINQNFQDTGFRPQISGPPPLISSSEIQSTATVTENGKHKTNDNSSEIVPKKAKQRSSSGNPSEQKTVSFSGLANLMNMKTVKSTPSEDDDYDT